jgi:tripartite-type tricarboxylate transporter receptor subunit TctC
MKPERTALPIALTTAAAAFLACSACVAHAQAYPSKSVRLVVPFAPGGGSDTVGRMLGQKLSATLGRQFIIDNRAGAGGRIAAELVAKSVPDGYTLIFATSSIMATAPALYAKLPFDMPKDFAPVSLVAYAVHVLVAHPSVPARSVKELIALSKRTPGRLTYASSGSGGPGHLSGELFTSLAGLKWVHVAYKGSAPATLSVVSGETDLMFSNIVPALPHIRSARLRALGVGSARRSVLLPDVPSIAESGLPGFDVRQLYGILAPAGTPRDVVTLLNEATAKAMQDPDLKERLLADGSEVLLSTPEEFERIIIAEIGKWSRVIRAAGIKEE